MTILEKPTTLINSFKGKAFLVLLAIFVLFIILAPIQKVDIGECGISYNCITGGIDAKYIESGWHFVMPFIQNITIYPTTEQTYAIARDPKAWLRGQDLSLWIPTKDNQKVSIDIYFIYKLEKESLFDIYKTYKGSNIKDIESIYFDHVFRDSVVNVVSQYSVFDFYSNDRVKIQNEICSLIYKEMQPKGIEIESVLIKDVRLTPEAEGILQAESRKQAALIDAQGKSEANQIIGKSLNDNIIRLQILEKLAPQLKLIILPNDGTNQIDLESLYNDIIMADKDGQKQANSTQGE